MIKTWKTGPDPLAGDLVLVKGTPKRPVIEIDVSKEAAKLKKAIKKRPSKRKGR